MLNQNKDQLKTGDNSYLSPEEHTDARHTYDQSFDFTRLERGRGASAKSYLK